MPSNVPGLFRWLLRAAAPSRERDWLLADLEEETAARIRTHGAESARAWSRRQVLASLIPLLGQRLGNAWFRLWRAPVYLLRHLRSDLMRSLRHLLHAPGFAFICILTLALGIGGNTAVFTLIDRVVLQPLPVERPA